MIMTQPIDIVYASEQFMIKRHVFRSHQHYLFLYSCRDVIAFFVLSCFLFDKNRVVYRTVRTMEFVINEKMY